MKSKVRKDFEKRFGKEQADILLESARSHKNGIHDREGSDPFIWAILICIGYQCVEIDDYRRHHGIIVNYAQFIEFCEDHKKEISKHDGDMDYLSFFAGIYDIFIEEED